MAIDFRSLPSVSAILAELAGHTGSVAPVVVTDIVRREIETAREALLAGRVVDRPALLDSIRKSLRDATRPRLRTVINATGIVLHTNLGRSVLSEAAADAAYRAASGYLNLELDLETGRRSHRADPVRDGIRRLTGAESGTVVNNCAAATVLVLRALAAGRDVIVSRGELIEIGGSFRIPEIMAVSGAILREVGTTNITTIADYDAAVGPNTGLIVKVHRSNFRQSGFTKSVGIGDLATLGKHRGIPVIDDVGSGLAIDDLAGAGDEPDVRTGLAAGADLVLFSGDKLLGGPQAGIVAGRADLVAKVERDPLMRAVRCDKMTLAALEATLRAYDGDAKHVLPTLTMLTRPLDELREASRALAERLRGMNDIADVTITDDESFAGGGTLPDRPFPTVVVFVRAKSVSEADLAKRLRLGDPAVMAFVRDGCVGFDLRTVLPGQIESLVDAIRRAVSSD
jgi:L-seryl-tRNA(Ser) seleniumtransferase